jgi:hypothetical protein
MPHRTTLACALLLVACGGEPGDDTTTMSSPAGEVDTGTATDDDADTGAPTSGGGAGEPPTNEEALTAWLVAGGYKGWPAESDLHESTGPHFGAVRTFVNPALFDSLEAGNTAHPKGAAAVKELYGGGDELRGWSAMIKGFENSTMDAPGDGWFWYEAYDGGVFGNSFGDGTCVGCHADSHPQFKDHVLTPFPLQ